MGWSPASCGGHADNLSAYCPISYWPHRVRSSASSWFGNYFALPRFVVLPIAGFGSEEPAQCPLRGTATCSKGDLS